MLMVKGKGAEWEHITVIEHKREQPKVQCKYCAHEFFGGACCIWEHFLHVKGAVGGVSKCRADDWEIE